MAAPRKTRLLKRPSLRGRSLRSIGRGVLRWLVLAYVMLELIVLISPDRAPIDHLNAFFIVAVFVASWAYLLIVSPQVHVGLPGVDARTLESEGTPRTIQVSRLSAQAAPVTVVNESPLPVLRAEANLAFALEDADEADSGQPAAKLGGHGAFSLPAGGTLPTTVANVFDHVGIYLVHSASVRVYDLLALFSRTRGTDGTLRVRVVPNIHRLTKGIPQQRKTSLSDLGIPDTPTDALDYDRVRDYQPGDPLKTIHWKLVAHGQGELYTKLFETSTTSDVTLLIDPYGPSPQDHGLDAAYHQHDTMLEGGFSLIEHARENGFTGHLRFVNRDGSLVETGWEGSGSLGWFVEVAARPAQAQEALAKGVAAVRSLRDGRSGYVIFATSNLAFETVEALIACHRAGIPLMVVHALPTNAKSGVAQAQRSHDARLRSASIGVIELTDGPQIVREVTTS